MAYGDRKDFLWFHAGGESGLPEEACTPYGSAFR